MTTSEKISCIRCNKKMMPSSFYQYRDGRICQLCKSCLTARIDNFDPSTYVWILEKLDFPYVPSQWNALRDRAFNRDPYKMTGMSVIGKYLGKMRLRQFNGKGYKDSKELCEELEERDQKKKTIKQSQKEMYEAELKVKLQHGEITLAQYKTLVGTDTLNKQLPSLKKDKITGLPTNKNINSYEQALKQIANPYRQEQFMPELALLDLGEELTKDDKIYLALKWGRLYKPAQWLSLEKLYKQFERSFDIEGAARIDTLKMICKTSLKMNEAIDMGDIETYQKLSRVYDSLMKSGKFTEAQNKQSKQNFLNSISALVDYVQTNKGVIPKYKCRQPQDVVDKIILDLKDYNKSLIYEDKALAQEIEKYLKDRRISEEMRQTKNGGQLNLEKFELTDQDFVDFNEAIEQMREHDSFLTDKQVQEQFKQRRVQQIE